MVATYNWTWEQGADLVMSLVYKEGPDGSEVAKNLTGYSLRMDIVSEGSLIYAFNSSDLSNNYDESGAADNEAVLGADGSINITVPRSLTLPGGKVYSLLMAADGESIELNYDMFLRNQVGKQTKILKGVIEVESSYTLWA